MKSLRKSLNGHRDHAQNISTPLPLPSLSKPPSAILPPKKVIRALHSYKSNAPQELSFEKGDFFHVLNDVNNQGLWYEAHNPMTGARGLVPCHIFEEFQKGTPTPRTPQVVGVNKPGSPNGLSSDERPLSAASAKVQAYYAVVLHDFAAERADELDAKAGDSITVVAQSNREWFVAKPIGRLGRPGLIPVSFVEIRDPTTGLAVQDVMALIDGGALPRVEEWKRAMMNYKANSIALGVLDESSRPAVVRAYSAKTEHSITAYGLTRPSHQTQQQQALPTDPPRPPTPKALPEGILLSADVQSFHYEMEEYWFRVHAIFQPYDPSGSQSLPKAKQLVLFRSYNDFYDFQVELLNAFPTEAGRPDHATRILPYMPGPAEQVDNEITNSRRAELDEYLHLLCELQHHTRYILEHKLVRTFLALKPGDVQVEIEPRVDELDALAQPTYGNQTMHEQGDLEPEYEAEFSRLQISERPEEEPASDGSDYEDDADVMGRTYDQDSYDYRLHEQVPPRHSANHDLNGTQPLRPRSRTTPSHDRTGIVPSSYGRPQQAPRSSGMDIDPSHADAQSRSSTMSSHDPSSVSTRASQAGSTATSRTSASGRSRSHSNATYNPPISATNPQTAFIKIKIFDEASSDLIAIRVHPKVTHAQLMDKVQARLGNNVKRLRYRDSINNELVNMDDDDEFRNWLDSTERHVLYAQ